MAKRTKYQNTLYIGEWNSICEVCGMKFKASDLQLRWDGLIVCKDDFEKRHPSESFRMPKSKNGAVHYVLKEAGEAEYWLWGDGVLIAWGDGDSIALYE